LKPKSIILAAGQGTRLRPLTESMPKCLVKIAGRPLLDYQLDALKACGIRDIHLLGGFEAECLKPYDLPLFLNENFATTNMVHSLFCAKELFLEEGELVISYGDIVYSTNTLSKLLSSRAPINVIVDMNWQSYWESRFEDPLLDAETLRLSSDDEILEIGAKPTDLSQIEGQYVGLLKLSSEGKRTFLEEYERFSSPRINGKTREEAYLTDFLQELINRGIVIQAVKAFDPWIEVDNPEDLESKITLERLNSIRVLRGSE
jgi:L-glutamine-phosphate cytidylyltransferase